MNAPALTRRESLWADEPVMRDGFLIDAALKAMGLASYVQQGLVDAVTAAKPDAWLEEAENSTAELLELICMMRSVLK